MTISVSGRIDSRLERQTVALSEELRGIVDDWASRGFTMLPGPAIQRMCEACLRAMDETYEETIRMFREESEAVSGEELWLLGLEAQAFLTGRLLSISVAPSSYAGSDEVECQELVQMKDFLLGEARQILVSVK
ncbi:hypothetical protein [Pseudomonas sp. CGJS7]|uniref:hypothetical protein n=1 Tax=Pseudomonas sp. CGJS7 TaxID=3109348 RepID=UPI003009AC12